MGKYTLHRNILLFQMLISTVILGVIVYFVYPFLDENKELIGTYYALTTILSFAIGILVEYLMLAHFERKKLRAEKEAAESTPTAEHESYRKTLEMKQKNRKILDYKTKYDTSL